MIAGTKVINVFLLAPADPYSKSLPAEKSAGRLRKIRSLKPYGLGDEVVVVVVVVSGDEDVFTFVSVLVAAPGSFTIVVLFSVFESAGGLVTLVSFFSQAGRSAARAKRQMVFFIRGFDG
jgi:hypothetical protein